MSCRLLLIAYCDLRMPSVHLETMRLASREFPGGERREIVDAFAHADKVHRQAELGRDRDQDAAARRAVELGHDKAGHAGHVAENLDLRERVLPDCRVEHQQHGMRGGRVDLLHHAHDLFQLIHQHRLVLQAAGGIDEQHIDAPRRAPR